MGNSNICCNSDERYTTVCPTEPLQLTEKQVVRMQALVRQFLQRRQFNYLIEQMRKRQCKHFYAKDFLSSNICNLSQPLVTKQRALGSGATYSGQFLGGLRHGTGKMTWPDGTTYEGQWEYNAAYGDGILKTPGNDEYTGGFYNNMFHGKGVYVNKVGRYEGEWRSGQEHGQGKEEMPNGAQFEGSYWRGKKQGFGVYVWEDGTYYKGKWMNNTQEGIGLFRWHDKRAYFGFFTGGQMHKLGFYKAADGTTYQGQFIHGQKCGYGVYTWTSTRHYQGYWQQSKQNGLGVYVSELDTKYGVWDKGKRVKWFEQEEITNINHMNQTFDVPTHFEADLSSLKEKLLSEKRYKIADIKVIFPEEVDKRLFIDISSLSSIVQKDTVFSSL